MLCLFFGLILALPGAQGVFFPDKPLPAASLVWVSGAPAKVERFKSGSYTASGISRSVEGCRLWLVGDPRVYVLGGCGDVNDVRWNRSTAISLAVDPAEGGTGETTIRGLKVDQAWVLDPGRVEAIKKENRTFAGWLFWGGLALTAAGVLRLARRSAAH